MMKKQTIALAALFLLGLAVADSALADRRGWGGRSYGRDHGWSHHHHSRVGVGFVVGAPFWSPWYYPPVPYYPPVVIERQAPPVYIEQSRETGAQARYSGYWYYCQSSGKYYPEVRGCPGGWIKVPPRP